MGCEDSELWITYTQNSRGNKPATTQLIELEFQTTKLNDLEDVLDHVFAQGWVESRYRSVSWWEKHDGTKIKNASRVDALLKEGAGKCESTCLRLVIADCPSVLWISYVFLKCPNAHASVQRINLADAADPCGNLERLAHVANFVFRKGWLPANVRSLVHWEDTCKKRIEEHVSVKDVLCEKCLGTDEDKPLRLVIGWDYFVAQSVKLETDFGSNPKIIHRAFAEAQEFKEEEQHVFHPDKPKAVPSSLIFLTPPSSSQTFSSIPRSFTAVDSVPSVWTLYIIPLGILLFLSWTAVLYPCIHRHTCEHCAIQ